MKRPIFGQMVSPAHLEAGAWFLFSRSSRMHLCMALKPDAERPGTDFDFVNLMSFSPEPKIDPQFQCVATSRWVPTVLQLDSVELEVAMDLRSIRTDAAQASDCFKPGAVLISGSDYRLVIAFADQGLHEGLAAPSLLDGTVHRMEPDKSIALVLEWRLIQRMADDRIREICRVNLTPGILT